MKVNLNRNSCFFYLLVEVIASFWLVWGEWGRDRWRRGFQIVKSEVLPSSWGSLIWHWTITGKPLSFNNKTQKSCSQPADPEPTLPLAHQQSGIIKETVANSLKLLIKEQKHIYLKTTRVWKSLPDHMRASGRLGSMKGSGIRCTSQRQPKTQSGPGLRPERRALPHSLSEHRNTLLIHNSSAQDTEPFQK